MEGEGIVQSGCQTALAWQVRTEVLLILLVLFPLTSVSRKTQVSFNLQNIL